MKGLKVSSSPIQISSEITETVANTFESAIDPTVVRAVVETVASTELVKPAAGISGADTSRLI